MTLEVIELFAGIGAQAQGLKEAGISFNSTVCEIDKTAYAAYCAIHGNTPNLGDITKVETLPPCDLLTYSFPCQDLSIAGIQRGMSKGSGTRSSLLWEVERLLLSTENKPDCLLMENVPAIINDKNRPAFNEWVLSLSRMGYTSSYQIMNAYDWGVPQNRLRCFMVSLKNRQFFKFPRNPEAHRPLKDILLKDVDNKYYFPEDTVKGASIVGNKSKSPLKYMGRLNKSTFESKDRIYHIDGIAPTITTKDHSTFITWPCATKKGYMDALPGDGLVMERTHVARGTVQPQRAPTLTTSSKCAGVVDQCWNVRYLTPMECWRLQGQPDENYYKALSLGISESALYRLAGNSIAVPCLTAIFKEIYRQDGATVYQKSIFDYGVA